MQIKGWINEQPFEAAVAPDMLLLDFLRQRGLMGVKRGCETSNCGLCTVWIDGKPVLSCSVLAARADGCHITTIEGMQEEAALCGGYLADEGAEQCGYCSPGLIMTVLAMRRELSHPSEDEIRAYLAGNLCRCTGYMGQLRAIVKYMADTESMESGEWKGGGLHEERS